jgi:hypothetical protein
VQHPGSELTLSQSQARRPLRSARTFARWPYVSIASLDRVLLCMNLIVFEGQKLTIGIVDDKRVNIQSMKMRR